MNDLDRANELIIDIALLIAFCDDEFHDSESKIINEWVREKTEKLSEKDKIKLKKSFDNAFKKFNDSTNLKQSNVLDLCKELQSFEVQSYEYDALDLSIKIMTADTIIHPNEVRLIFELSKIHV